MNLRYFNSKLDSNIIPKLRNKVIILNVNSIYDDIEKDLKKKWIDNIIKRIDKNEQYKVKASRRIYKKSV